MNEGSWEAFRRASKRPGDGGTSEGSYPIPRRVPRRGGWRRPGVRAAGTLLLATAGLWAPACQVVPVTGRHAINLFSPAEDVRLGREAYAEVLAGATVLTSGPELERVERVMRRLTAVADDPGFEWELALIRDDSVVNAFALPGGKMAVYTGILPVAEDEAGLAVVMGHEIGHVVAQHGTQRMTQSMGVETVLQLVHAEAYRDLAGALVQLAVELPYSRSHESEADHIGLVYMARAGYDPRRAIEFWQRMASLGGSSPPEFLSTHPSHGTRIHDLEGWLPEAMRAYRAGAQLY